MLTAVPNSWLSWNFSLRGAVGSPVAELRVSSWRQRGSIVVGGVTYTIRRKGILGPFVMEDSNGSLAASAVKPSALRRELVVTEANRAYVLKAVSAFRRKFGVFRGDEQVGSIEPEHWWSRRARIRFTGDISPRLQTFLIWLTLLLWKRDSDAAASGT